MQIHQITKPQQKTKKRVGRGGKRGTYSGRGVKGQRARAGSRIRPQIRDYFEKMPKVRGMTRKPGQHDNVGSKFNRPTKTKAPLFVLDIMVLNEAVQDGDIIDIKYLLNKELVRPYKGHFPRVKLLGKGNFTKKITIRGILISESARKQIEASGGTVQP